MNRYLGIIPLVIASLPIGCDGRIGGYLAASSISENGFAGDAKEIRGAQGRKIKLWGFVDHYLKLQSSQDILLTLPED